MRLPCPVTPAHYLSAVMRNFLLSEIEDDARLRKKLEYAIESLENPDDERPPTEAARNELRKNVQFVVIHELDRRSRIALSGHLKGHSIAQIARDLSRSERAAGKVSKVQASLILFRAKQRFEEIYRKKYGPEDH